MIEDFFQLPNIEGNTVTWHIKSPLCCFIEGKCNEIDPDGELDQNRLGTRLTFDLFQALRNNPDDKILEVWPCWLSNLLILVLAKKMDILL